MLNVSTTNEINTERLLLRRFVPSDAASVHRNWASDPDVQLNYGEPVYKTKARVSKLLDGYIKKYEKPFYFRWAIIEKASGECIGQIAYFLVDTGNEFAEIEYCIGTAFQGKGYATEAVKAFLPVMAERLGITEVYGIRLLENAASGRVLEKCGFQTIFTGEGAYHDGVYPISRSICRL